MYYLTTNNFDDSIAGQRLAQHQRLTAIGAASVRVRLASGRLQCSGREVCIVWERNTESLPLCRRKMVSAQVSHEAQQMQAEERTSRFSGIQRGDERTDETARFHFSSNEMCNVLEVSSN